VRVDAELAVTERELNGFFVALSGGAVERRFGFGAAIAHESASFHVGARVRRLGSAPAERQNQIVRHTIWRAQSCVRRRLAGARYGMICFSTLLNQEFAEAPVSMEAGASADRGLRPERSQRRTLRHEELHGADP